MDVAYASFETPLHLDAVSRMTAFAFGSSPESCREWLCERVGPANLRVVGQGIEVHAAGALLPMGQYFGGRSVRMVGVAGVSVAPEHRGRGHSVTLMR